MLFGVLMKVLLCVCVCVKFYNCGLEKNMACFLVAPCSVPKYVTEMVQ